MTDNLGKYGLSILHNWPYNLVPIKVPVISRKTQDKMYLCGLMNVKDLLFHPFQLIVDLEIPKFYQLTNKCKKKKRRYTVFLCSLFS